MTARANLPDRRPAEILTFQHEGHRYRATFGYFPDGRLGEIFLDTGKPNATIQMHADDSAVLVSLLLQHGVDPRLIQHSISGPIRAALDNWLVVSP
jgi:hypothetical protein